MSFCWEGSRDRKYWVMSTTPSPFSSPSPSLPAATDGSVGVEECGNEAELLLTVCTSSVAGNGDADGVSFTPAAVAALTEALIKEDRADMTSNITDSSGPSSSIK